MVIWKYELEIKDLQHVDMPYGAKILSVANQNGNLCMWASVDPSAEKMWRFVEIIGTGHLIPTDLNGERIFIGTVVIGSLVWHVFERR